MKRLAVIISKLNVASFAGLKWNHGIKISGALLIILVTVSYCFRENVLQKVEVYQTDEPAAEETPYYIEILSVTPAPGAVNVSLNSHIDVVFNDNINMSTVDDSTTFTVNDGSVDLSGTFVYYAALKNIEFTPSAALTINTLYTVTVTTGIKNLAGESMAADYSWSFTTVAFSQPEIYLLSPLSEIFTGDSYDFGNIIISGTKTETFTIGNYGSSNLDINAGNITIAGADFSLSSDPTPVTLGPGGTTTFSVDFTSASAGVKNAVLTIANNDADESSFVINLTGTVVAASEPEIQITNGGIILVSPVSTVDLGTVAAGDTVSITLIMYNIGSSNLVVPANGVSIGGTNPDLFSTDFGTAMTAIIPGATKSFNVSFSSPSKVNARATITFQNNDTDEAPFTIKLKARVK